MLAIEERQRTEDPCAIAIYCVPQRVHSAEMLATEERQCTEEPCAIAIHYVPQLLSSSQTSAPSARFLSRVVEQRRPLSRSTAWNSSRIYTWAVLSLLRQHAVKVEVPLENVGIYRTHIPPPFPKNLRWC